MDLIRVTVLAGCVLLAVEAGPFLPNYFDWYTRSDDRGGRSKLNVEGKIPEWLNGEFLIAGAVLNASHLGGYELEYVMDGWGKQFRFEIFGETNSARVTYGMLPSEWRNATVEAGRPADGLIFMDTVPSRNMTLEDLGTKPMLNPYVKTFFAGNSYYGVDDMYDWLAYEMQPYEQVDELTGAGFFRATHTAERATKLPLMQSTHLLSLPGEDLWYAIQSQLMSDPKHLMLVKINITDVAAGKPVDSVEIGRVEGKAFQHSFALCSKYAIIFEQPVWSDPLPIMEYKEILMSMKTDFTLPNKYYVMDLETGNSTEYILDNAGDSFNHLHVSNCKYDEKKDSLVFFVDTVKFNAMDQFIVAQIRNKTWRDDFHNMAKGSGIVEIRLPLSGLGSPDVQKGEFFMRVQESCEFPIYNPEMQGMNTCYSYHLAGRVGMEDSTWCKDPNQLLQCASLIKIDECNEGKILGRFMPDGHMPGEPYFVPRPGFTKEDDGVVISKVFNFLDESSHYLAILDPKDMSLIANLTLPTSSEGVWAWVDHANWKPF